MKNVYLIVGFFILLASACKEYDDIAQWNMANNQEQRLTALEELCSQINTNLQALHDLIGASNNGDYILNVSPIQKEGVEIGYTITFAKSGTITIYHGKDGQKGEQGDSGEGTIPSIGIRQDIDGVHYWILNNEWLVDESGKKVKASGTDGQNGKSAYELAQEKGYTGTLEEWFTTLKGETGNSGKSAYEIAVEKGYSGTESEWLETLNGNNGQTPKLKIENGRWLLSMDNGNTWEDIGKATGDKGQDGTGGDSMFKKIDYTTSNEYVIFTLADNTELKLPKYGQGGGSTGELSITFSETTDILVNPGLEYNITYSIDANPNAIVDVIGLGNFKATVTTESATSGTITIMPPQSIEENCRVLVLISNNQTTTFKILTFKYPEDCCDIITIPDNLFKQYLIKYFDKDGDRKISKWEALLIKRIEINKIPSIECFDIESLEGIQYFPNLSNLYIGSTKITSLDFTKNKALKNIELNLTIHLTNLNMKGHPTLENLIIYGVGYDCGIDMSGCTALKRFNIENYEFNSLNAMGCTALGSFTLKYTAKQGTTPLLNFNECISLSIATLYTNDSNILNNILKALPQVTGGLLYINRNNGNSGYDPTIAQNKGWQISSI